MAHITVLWFAAYWAFLLNLIDTAPRLTKWAKPINVSHIKQQLPISLCLSYLKEKVKTSADICSDVSGPNMLQGYTQSYHPLVVAIVTLSTQSLRTGAHNVVTGEA